MFTFFPAVLQTKKRQLVYFDYSNDALVRFTISTNMSLAETGVMILNFSRAELEKFKELLEIIPLGNSPLGHRNRTELSAL